MGQEVCEDELLVGRILGEHDQVQVSEVWDRVFVGVREVLLYGGHLQRAFVLVFQIVLDQFCLGDIETV